MKKYLFIVIVHCAFVFGLSTERVDIIKQTDGTVYKGKIIEQNIKDGEGWVKIEIAGGSVIHITKDKIESIELLSASLELIEPVNFPLYEFSGRSEGEVTH